MAALATKKSTVRARTGAMGYGIVVSDPVPDAPPPGVGPRRRTSPLWAKLWALVVTTNLAGFLVAIWTARIIRHQEPSPTTEQALLALYYGTMLLVAVIEAFLVDEIVFRGAFRKTHLQGRTPRYARNDEDVEEIATTLQRSTVSFPFTVLLCLGLSYLVFNLANRDFDTYYRRVGKYASVLRTTDPERLEARLDAIAELSIRREPEVVPLLVRQLERGGTEAAWAAWALGRFGDLPRPSQLFPPLVAAARKGDPVLHREAVIALGRLQHRAIAPELQRLVREDLDRDGRVDLRLLYGLGAVQVTSSIPVLTEVLHRGDEPSQRVAAWALAQHRDQRGGRQVVDILHERILSATLPVRCAIVHALGILADERSNLVLMEAYDRATPEERVEMCEHQRIAMRPDGKADEIVILMPRDIFGFKIIQSMAQMRATTPEIRAKVEPWLEARRTDPTATPAIREAARSLLEGIRSGRDDSRLRSAAEVFEPGG
ncbi:MAG: HEAT repeat domain-containing protein [Deltaproteobacteria bacterium]|nr:MAG: HEAT repeat domain-containing protein [Deltaproteobacteria bacterium]